MCLPKGQTRRDSYHVIGHGMLVFSLVNSTDTGDFRADTDQDGAGGVKRL